MSVVQLREPGQGQATQRDDGLGGRCASPAARAPIAPTRPTVSSPGRCHRPVPDTPTCRQRAP